MPGTLLIVCLQFSVHFDIHDAEITCRCVVFLPVGAGRVVLLHTCIRIRLHLYKITTLKGGVYIIYHKFGSQADETNNPSLGGGR